MDSSLSLFSSETEAAPEQAPRKAKKKPAPDRDDVNALCARLADRIEGNGSLRPDISSEWRTAARLLLDKDKRDLDQALRLIDWTQADEFWHKNCLSMPTFRRQYDQLRLKARDTARWRLASPHDEKVQLTDAEVRAILQPPHRDYEDPPQEIENDPAARSAWFKDQREQRWVQYRADAEKLLATSEVARNILARLRRTS